MAVLGLAAVYFVAARLGLSLDAVAGFATLVWPATGIALAVLVTFGYRLWPGVFIGAFVANLLTGAPLLVAIGIAVGNTLEAVVGTYALRRIPGFRPSLDRIQDAVGLIVLAAGLSTMISATIGVSSLYLGGVAAPPQVGSAWRAWWLGDVIADLVVAPVLLVWAMTRAWRESAPRLVEASALLVTVLTVDLLIFGGLPSSDAATFGQAYLVFPPLIWSGLRFGQRGAVSATFLTTVIAVWGTAAGHGPFARSMLHENLFALQVFMAVTAATFLVLGASISERYRAVERLRHAHDEVAEANRSKSEFLAVMSHELRTPLNAIGGYVDLMLMELEDPITPAQRAHLTRIRTNEQHLASMIEDVLSFAKAEAGRISLTMEVVRVCEVLGSLQPLIDPELKRKELTFRSDPGDPSLLVHADGKKLKQILVNLLVNAMKFTPVGGQIDVGAVRAGDMVRIWVSDTGIGISPEQLERVFEPFYQVEQGTTRRHSGIGLGLAIARDLARSMGGDLRLESQPGKGTSGWLELPAA